ncbi:hypothetical protein [Pseudonocardia humida]|uniref:Uncharacterized protein n=1 Tax=Pseudonocardia humida TaxID=2800819 RepID=A0ABT0ZZY3_9PSEU|nr:hypothetical protein [Pseudonocardia humida]MCO1656312.1 hypothetical protein [Pseudonocardia humida]
MLGAVVAGDVEAAGQHVVLGVETDGPDDRGQQRARGRGRVRDAVAQRADVDGRRRVGDVRDDLQRGPEPARPRQRDGVQAVGDDLRDGARREQRQRQALRHRLARAGHGGGLAGRVVADPGHRPAGGGGPGELAVPDGVGGPVQAGGLAVPEPGHPVVAAAGERGEHLGPGHGGGGQLLVDARAEHHAGLVQVPARPAHLQVDAAQRRALVARDEGTRVQPAFGVEPALFEDQPDQCLDARDERPAGRRAVLVVEGHRARTHLAASSS